VVSKSEFSDDDKVATVSPCYLKGYKSYLPFFLSLEQKSLS